MTGILDLDGQRAIVEQDDGDLAIYATSEVEQKSDGTWGLADGATPTGTLELEALLAKRLGTETDPIGEQHVESSHTGELSVSSVLDVPSYPTQADLPADRSVGFIALIEDQNRIYFEGV